MGVIDDLSRDRPASSLAGVPYVDIGAAFPGAAPLFDLCNPLVDRSLADHHAAFCQVHEILAGLV